MQRILAAAAATFLVASAMPACAVDIGLTGKIGYEFGGDDLATVTFTNGRTETLNAGEGLVAGIGASILNDAKTLELEVMASAKFQFIHGSNGDLTWRRFPVDVLGFYRFKHLRIGGGLTYHLAPKVSGSGVAGGATHEYDAALGYVLQADWLFSGADSGKGAYVGLRYTNLEYELKGGGFTASADSVGLSLGYRF